MPTIYVDVHNYYDGTASFNEKPSSGCTPIEVTELELRALREWAKLNQWCPMLLIDRVRWAEREQQ
jgi:hypothetical protein